MVESRVRHRAERGVTLIELLIAMGIMSLVSAMVIGVWFSLGDSYSYTTTSSKAREYTRDAVSRMAREIRDAGDGPNGAGAFQVAEAGCSARQITFYSFFNEPGADDLDATARRVQFSLADDGKLYRRVDADNDGSWERQDVLCTDVVNYTEGASLSDHDLFTYMVVESDGSRVPVTQPSDPTAIVSVRIRLLVDLNPDKSPVLMDLTTSVQPRNLRQL